MHKAHPWILLFLLAAGLAAWYVLFRAPEEKHPSVMPVAVIAPDMPAPVQHPVEDIPLIVDVPEESEPESLPALEDSDGTVLGALTDLAGAEAVTGLFLNEQVVNRIVATVDSLTDSKIAPRILPLHPPTGAFIVTGSDDGFTISPDNAARYAPYIAVATALDIDRAKTEYVRYYPLFQQAYESLGYPGAYFNDRLVEVIDHLLETPRLQASPNLVKPEAVYRYADPELEALSAGQKMLLRTGPEHGELLRQKLGAFRAAITAQELSG